LIASLKGQYESRNRTHQHFTTMKCTDFNRDENSETSWYSTTARC